jgi:hypothetical protein
MWKAMKSAVAHRFGCSNNIIARRCNGITILRLFFPAIFLSLMELQLVIMMLRKKKKNLKK